MSAIEMVDDIFYYIKRYLFPTLFLVVGVYALLIALSPNEVELNNGEVLYVEQNPLFLYGSLLVIVGSIIWFLYLFGLINSIGGYIIMAALLVGSGVVLYYDYNVIREDVRFNNMYAERAEEIQTRLMDIKEAQVAYREVNGMYTDSFDDLISFVKNGKKMDFVRVGALPERKITPEERDLIYGDNRPIDRLMNDQEGAFLARMNSDSLLDGQKFKRDTVYLPVMDAVFNSKSFKERRSKLPGKIPFSADSLRYVPYSQELVKMDTGSVMKGEIKAPTLKISMKHPMEDPIDGHVEYTIGATDDNHLRDNWSK